MARVLSAVVCAIALAACHAPEERALEIKDVIDRNTGSAHMTRGVNMYTLIAIRSCVSESDIPALVELLRDDDNVVRLAAAGVLSDFGGAGHAALSKARDASQDPSLRAMIDDTLAGMDAPDRKRLKDYPLTRQEQRRIKGCTE